MINSRKKRKKRQVGKRKNGEGYPVGEFSAGG
jgi:hypothetical protein